MKRSLKTAGDNPGCPQVIVCDLDGTLVNTNSFTLFVKWAFKKFPFYSIPIGMLVAGRKMRLYSHAVAKRWILKLLRRRLGEREMLDYLSRLQKHLNPEVTGRVFAEPASVKILASAAPALYAEPFAAMLGFGYVVATAIDGPECRGEEKVRRVETVLTGSGISPKDVTVISDHRDDLPLFRWNRNGSNYLVIPSGMKPFSPETDIL